MLSISGIKKTIKQHTADMDITDSVDFIKSRLHLDFTISQPRLLYNPYRPNTVIYYIKCPKHCQTVKKITSKPFFFV
jgi:hypothetical protein